MQKKRKGDWIQTFTGRQFWPLDAKPEDVFIEDIAHSLSNQCRFAGHSKMHYSVAQHSVYVSRFCNPQNALWGLLHDATEAYLIDLPRPIKKLPAFSAYGKTEAKLAIVICNAFDLPIVEPADVHEADLRMCATEVRDIMQISMAPWISCISEPYDIKIENLTPMQAERMFLERFYELNDKRIVACL